MRTIEALIDTYRTHAAARCEAWKKMIPHNEIAAMQQDTPRAGILRPASFFYYATVGRKDLLANIKLYVDASDTSINADGIINHVNVAGLHPLFVVAGDLQELQHSWISRSSIAHLLVKTYGACVDYKQADTNWNALTIALIQGTGRDEVDTRKLITLLLESGINHGTPDLLFGNTPLMWTLISNKLSPKLKKRIVELLIKHGMFITDSNNDGVTPFDVARHLGLKEIDEMLEQDETRKENHGAVFTAQALPDGWGQDLQEMIVEQLSEDARTSEERTNTVPRRIVSRAKDEEHEEPGCSFHGCALQ